MITNILLGLILGIVITGYIITNKQVTQIQSNNEYVLNKLRGVEGVNYNNNKLIEHLLDRFNNFILRYNESKNLLETKYNNNVKHFDKILTDINNKINEVNECIKSEHIITRSEIKKQAKISSKINSKTKTSKSINKQ